MTAPCAGPPARRRVPPVQLVLAPADFERVEFYDDMALIEVPVEALGRFPFKNDQREDDPRLKRIVQSIREDGYNSVSPIKVRIGRRGNWVVVDGGHRLTAARKVAGEFWPNLLGRKVRTLTFLVFRTPYSNALAGIERGSREEAEILARIEAATGWPAAGGAD